MLDGILHQIDDNALERTSVTPGVGAFHIGPQGN